MRSMRKSGAWVQTEEEGGGRERGREGNVTRHVCLGGGRPSCTQSKRTRGLEYVIKEEGGRARGKKHLNGGGRLKDRRGGGGQEPWMHALQDKM